MAGQNPINLIWEELGKNDKKFEHILDKIIKAGISIINNTEELKEELLGFDDIYQTCIFDANISYWLEVSHGKLHYEKGVNPQALFKMIFSKDLFIKILKDEIGGADAFMKGKIKVEGSLSQGLRYIKLFRTFFKYISTKNGFKYLTSI
jgi:putative sterol carrier protein